MHRERRRRHVCHVPLLMLAAGLFVAGPCGCARTDPAGGAPAPGAARLTPTILDADRMQRALLAHPAPPSRFADDLAIYHRLWHALHDPGSRDDAERELFARWRDRPEHFLWIETAVVNYWLLSRKQDYVQLRQAAAGADSTTAVARFVYGRRFQGRRADAYDSYLLAERREHELDPLQRLWLHSRLAETENSAGHHARARERLSSRLPEAWRLGGPLLAAHWWCQLARCSRSGGWLDDALHAADWARFCAERAALPALVIQALLERGHAHEARLEYPSAERAYLQCLQSARDHGLGHLERDAVTFLGVVHSMRGDLDAELETFRLAVELSHRNRNPGDIIRSTAALANCLRRSGLLDSTRARLEAATRLQQETFGPATRHHLLDTVWQLYLLQIGSYAAVDSLQACIDRSEADRPALSRLEPVMALIEQGLKTGRPELAYRGLERAAQILAGPLAGSLSYEDRLGLALVSARFLARQGEFRLAEQELAKTAQLLAGGELREWQWEYERARGELARLAGDLATARHAFSRCGELAAQIGDPSWIQQSRILLGRALIDLDLPEQAATLFRTARQAPEYWPRLAAALYLGMASARQHDFRAALDHFAAADSLLKPDAPGDLLARLRLEQGKALAALRRPAAALARLREAAPGQGAREVRFENEALLAFDADVQRERAEFMIGLLHDVPTLAGPAGAAVEALALAVSVRWRVDAAAAAPTPQGLRPRSPVVVYFAGQQRCFAWLGTAAGWTMWELPAARALHEMARAVIADWEQSERAVAWTQAAALAEFLLGPVLPSWPPGQTLHLATDGLLAELPWAALPLPQATGASPRLIVDHGPLVHIANLEPVPPVAADRATATGRLLAIGADGRTDRRAAIAPVLRHAEAEARDVAALWPPGHAELYLGHRAHWANLRAADLTRFAVIHIATHATVTQGVPGASTLRLAAQNGGTPLTLPEVRDLPLAAPLVYLSCCEAANQGWDTGSGLNSFTRAFLQAGAAAVVAPTIRVEDAAARLLARRFYHHWLAGAAHAEALRRAQADLKDAAGRLGHPAAWAFYGCYLPGPS